MPTIWITEYCGKIDAAFATKELAEEYVDEQEDSYMYNVYQIFYYCKRGAW